MKLSNFLNDAALCRWIGRIIGSMLVILLVTIAIGEGMPNPFIQPVRIQIGFLALALLMAGILAGWKWELWGGIVSLFGWCLFVVAVISLNRLNWFIVTLAVPGVLYLTSAFLRRCPGKHPPGRAPD